MIKTKSLIILFQSIQILHKSKKKNMVNIWEELEIYNPTQYHLKNIINDKERFSTNSTSPYRTVLEHIHTRSGPKIDFRAAPDVAEIRFAIEHVVHDSTVIQLQIDKSQKISGMVN